MIRRKKEEVLKELPAKQRTIIPMQITNKQEYKTIKNDFLDWMFESKGKAAAEKAKQAKALVKIGQLKQAVARGKMNGAIDWIKDFLEVEDKLVVFCTHKETINVLMEEFKGIVVKVDGSTKDKQAAVDAFQDNKNIRLFVGNIKAAGTGITLTAASNLAFLELGWTPGEHTQAEDRIHRIGQENAAVTIYYLIGQNTIEEDIIKLIDEKREVLDAVLDGKETDEESLLTELLKRLNQKKG
jgi:SWI/SNF-related matrix-associated actin-dependent regulator 1 of chromatin subfamily A